MSTVDLNECSLAAIQIAKKAGVMIKEGFYKVKTVEQKENRCDLVTETDKNVEIFVIAEFKKIFPTHKFIGEESTAAGVKNELTDEPTWIIDPVDGTMNFVHSFPHTCISIGLTVKKQAVVGVVFNPILDLMYTAVKGKGAYLNDNKINVSGQTKLSHSLIMSEGWCRPSEEKMAIVRSNTEKMVNKCHGPRSLGSAALDMCMVAQGGADAYFEIGIHAWDMAGGAIIVTEAGGVVMDMNGSPLDLMNRRVFCASSQALADEMLTLMTVYDEQRD